MVSISEKAELSPLESFITRAGNNADMPLEFKSRPTENFICSNTGVLCTSMRGMTHDDLASLPEQVQKVIEDIKLASSIEEKSIIAHNFTNAYVKYSRSHETNSFDEIANNPEGDCDNFAVFKAGLLFHGGVPPENIILAKGDVRYDNDEAVGHVFVIVSDENDFLYLDNNLQDVEIISPEQMIINGYAYHPDSREYGKARNVTIAFFSHMEDGTGQLFKSDEADSMMLNRATKEVLGRWWEKLKSVFEDNAYATTTGGNGSNFSNNNNAVSNEKTNVSSSELETPNPRIPPVSGAARPDFHP